MLGIEEIKKLLPHRYPFLLIDKVDNIVINQSCTAYKAVSYNEWFFRGHFPQYPVMPGVLIVEAMAQTAGVLAMYSVYNNTDLNNAEVNKMMFASINNVRFKKPVVPGDTLKLDIQITQRKLTIWKFQAVGSVDGQISNEAEFTAVM